MYFGSNSFDFKLENPSSSIKHFFKVKLLWFNNLIVYLSSLKSFIVKGFSKFSIISLDISLNLFLIVSITSKGFKSVITWKQFSKNSNENSL